MSRQYKFLYVVLDLHQFVHDGIVGLHAGIHPQLLAARLQLRLDVE